MARPTRGVRIWALLTALCCLGASEHRPQVDLVSYSSRDGWLTAAVSGSQLLDARTRSTIESGLPGTCVFEIVVEQRNRGAVLRRKIERDLRLDLWADRYVLRTGADRHEFHSLAAADSAWSRLSRVPLMEISKLASAVDYRLRVFIDVRPLSAEDRGRVADFVSQTQGDREEFALNVSAVIRRWLRPSSDGDRRGGFTTPYFRRAELKVDP